MTEIILGVIIISLIVVQVIYLSHVNTMLLEFTRILASKSMTDYAQSKKIEEMPVEQEEQEVEYVATDNLSDSQFDEMIKKQAEGTVNEE